MSLPWITKGLTAKAYPYQITDGVMGFKVWIYDSHGLTCLARDLPTMKAAKTWAESHKAKASETA